MSEPQACTAQDRMWQADSLVSQLPVSLHAFTMPFPDLPCPSLGHGAHPLSHAC